MIFLSGYFMGIGFGLAISTVFVCLMASKDVSIEEETDDGIRRSDYRK